MDLVDRFDSGPDILGIFVVTFVILSVLSLSAVLIIFPQ